MRRAVLLGALALAACDEGPEATADWFASESWNDGAAVVCVYRGRFKKYGTWREAEARDYLIREFLHPEELTKRDTPQPEHVRVIKANRHVAFNTGTYDYRLMASLFFARDTARLVKAVASSQDGCGLTFQRWDRGGRHSWDSYWEGEGRGDRALAKKPDEVFADELPYLARAWKDGAAVTVLPSLARNKVGGAAPVSVVVRRDGAATRLEAGGEPYAEFRYDDDGFLEAWTVAGEQEFTRVAKRRLYYWQKTAPEDRALLEPAK